MAKLLMHWTLMCSKCEKFIELSPADKVPLSCPHCGVKFEEQVQGKLPEDSDRKSTFVPEVEKILKRIAGMG